jgi:hypothetical protein
MPREERHRGETKPSYDIVREGARSASSVGHFEGHAYQGSGDRYWYYGGDAWRSWGGQYTYYVF